jgi:PKD repeat protein
MKTNRQFQFFGTSLLAVLLGTAPCALAQHHVAPPKPAVAPLIGEHYANDADGDRIDDELFARAQRAMAAERAATTPTARAQARAQLDEPVNVELIFKQPVTQQQLDTFEALGGEITHVYKAVSYGWNARLPLRKISAVPAVMGESLVLVHQPKGGDAQLDLATRTGRVRPTWSPGFAGSATGFTGNSNTTIAILDTGVDESHADLNGRRVFWHDYTASAYVNPTDVDGHGSHVAGIALGTGATAGSGTGTLKITTFNSLSGWGNNHFDVEPMELPTNSVTITCTARWNGGTAGGTRLRWFQHLRTDPTTNWSGVISIVGTSPLTLSFTNTLSSAYVYSPGLFQSNGISDYVITSQISNYPGVGDGFNKLRGVAARCYWAGAKVLSDTGSYGTDLGAAIDDLVANRTNYNIKIMNLSLGGGLDGSLRQKVNSAANNGIIMAVAAGNRGSATKGNYGTGVSTNIVTEPGRAAMALTVAASSSLNQLTDYTREGFLSPDATPGQEEDYKPDLMAPGGSYYQAWITSIDSNASDGPAFSDAQTNDYKKDIGTSMATPFAAGCAALVIDAMEQSGVVWDFNSSQHSRFVKLVLCATASESNTNREGNLNNPTLQRAGSITNGMEILPPGKDLHEGYGMINADAAVEAVSLAYTNGTVATNTLGPSVTDRRVWARSVNLLGGRNFTVTLTNPAAGDFDLYLYSATPSAYGTPVLLAASTQAGNGANETLNYTAASDQSALLVVKRVSGSGTFSLLGNLAPAVDITADVTSGLAPLTVNFINLTTGATNYLWDFGDGNTSTDKDASNTYASAGTYTVTLSAVGPGGTNSLTKPGLIVVTNPPPPVVGFSATPLKGQWPLYVSFSNNTTGATNYLWDFGDGNTSDLKDAANSYTAPGDYSVTLTAVGPGGTSSVTVVSYINVTNPAPPGVDFTATPTVGLAPLAVSFTSLADGGTNYFWSFGDGDTSALKEPAHTFTNAGSYSVTFTVIRPGGTNSITKPGLILATNPPPPIVDFVGAPTNGLVPLTVYFTNLTTGATSFTWDFGDGDTSTDEDPSHTFTNAGSYTITLTAASPGGTNALTWTNYVVVTNLPLPTVDFAASPTNGFAPLTVAFSNLTSGATNYAWSFGDGNTSASEQPANTYTNPGAYAVTLIVVGPGGTNTLSRSSYILVAPLPVITTYGVSEDEFAFGFDTIPGKVYVIEYKDSLDDPAWQTLQTVPGDGASKTITIPIANTPQRFFRLRVL